MMNFNVYSTQVFPFVRLISVAIVPRMNCYALQIKSADMSNIL